MRNRLESELCYVNGLRSLLTLNYIVLNSLALVERLEAFHVQSGVMNEYIVSFRIGNESIALLVVKPLNSTLKVPIHIKFNIRFFKSKAILL